MPVTRLPALVLALAVLMASLAPPAEPVDGGSRPRAASSVAGSAAAHVAHASHEGSASHPCPGHAASAEAPLAVWKARCPCGCGDASAPAPAHGRLVAVLAARLPLPAAALLCPAPASAEPAAPAAPLARVDHVPRPA
jgi:hypothetical protein